MGMQMKNWDERSLNFCFPSEKKKATTILEAVPNVDDLKTIVALRIIIP